MQCLFFAALVQLILLASGWHYGRATFYGNEPWYWSIHGGSCGYGYQCKNEGTGWDIAAISDQHWGYSGSCGRCYEFKCNPASFTDGYGQTLDRSNSCFDPEASVVARVVDECPCNYANNAYSNRRWCCGDTDHFDLSVWAFEKLSELKLGVISVYYREVDCSYQPYKRAYSPYGEHWGEEPGSYGESCPKNQFYANEQSNGNGYNNQVDESAAVVQTAESPAAVHSSNTIVYGEEQGQGSFQLDTWNANAWEVDNAGIAGGKAICGQLYPGGAMSLTGQPGSFNGHMVLEFWTRIDSGLADASINIHGTNGGCQPLLFTDLQASEYKDGLAKYVVSLEQFVDGDSNMDSSTPFTGCNYMSPSQLQTISFHNFEYYEQYFCIDEVALKQN